MLKFKFMFRIGLIYLATINIINAIDNLPEKPTNYDLVDVLQYKINQDPSQDYNPVSGYYALKNGLVILGGIKNNYDPTLDINDQGITEELFQNVNSRWRSYIINLRANKAATKFIRINLLENINDYKKVNKNKNGNIVHYLIQVLDNVVESLKEVCLINAELDKIHKISAEDIKNTFVDAIINRFAIKDKSELIGLLPDFKSLNFKIRDKDIQDITVSENRKESADQGVNLPGSWLSAAEILDLYELEKANFILTDKNQVVPLICIKDIKKDFNSILNAINNITVKDNTLLIIKLDNRWVPCVISKIADKVRCFVADLFNANLIENVNFSNFVKLINVAVKEISNSGNNSDKHELKDDPFDLNGLSNSGSKEDTKEKDDYRSPYFDIDTEELPKLEQFFNGFVPNKVINLIDHLKNSNRNNFKTDVKKGLILYGPPGTGKSTIAEVIARESGREVLFIDGGSFKTEYQGSGARIVSELFEAAKAKNKPVVIIIDEIDGATSKLRKNFGTSEDNQTIKKIISELNKHLLSKDSSIYLICTTNYLESIEGAILNRFTAIEVNAPNYKARLDILANYLKLNGITTQTDFAKNFEVSQEFLKMLATATSGWTGRDLQALVNNAVSEYKNPRLLPENDSVWRFMIYNKYDFRNRPLRSLLTCPIAGLIPILAYKKNYTKLEKFLYSSYISELQKIQRIKASEADLTQNNDSINKMIKNTVITTTTSVIVAGILTAAHKYFFSDSEKDKSNIAQLLTTPPGQ